MDIQKRKMEIEEKLGQVRNDIGRMEQMLRDASVAEQRMIGALSVCNEILATPETSPVVPPEATPVIQPETPQ